MPTAFASTRPSLAPASPPSTAYGAANASSGQGDHVVHAGLVITGAGLTGVTVSLTGQMASLPSYSALAIRPGATTERLEVDLPGDVLPGSYTLGVVNQYGAASYEVPSLRC
jgi:hypothetical protein